MMEDPAEKTPEVIYIEKSGVRICDANILADLCEEAGRKSTEIRDCLNTYKLNTPTKQLKCMFSQFKKPIIVDTLKFLNATDHNWDDYVKEACVHELICRVQNLQLLTNVSSAISIMQHARVMAPSFNVLFVDKKFMKNV